MGSDFEPSWKNRRRTIFASLIFCAFCVAYVMIWGETDSRVHETIVWGAFLTAAGIIGSYVFGAAWENNHLQKR